MRAFNREIFLSVKDLMRLVEYSCYNSAQRAHKEIRRKLGKVNTKKLTVKEYCEFEQVDYEYIWRFLRGDIPMPE